MGKGNVLGAPKGKGENESFNNVNNNKTVNGKHKDKSKNIFNNNNKDKHLVPWKRKGFISNADPRRKSTDFNNTASSSSNNGGNNYKTHTSNTSTDEDTSEQKECTVDLIDSDSDDELMASLLEVGYDQITRNNSAAWDADSSDSESDLPALPEINGLKTGNDDMDSRKRPRAMLGSSESETENGEQISSEHQQSGNSVSTISNNSNGNTSDVSLKLREVWANRFSSQNTKPGLKGVKIGTVSHAIPKHNKLQGATGHISSDKSNEPSPKRSKTSGKINVDGYHKINSIFSEIKSKYEERNSPVKKQSSPVAGSSQGANTSSNMESNKIDLKTLDSIFSDIESKYDKNKTVGNSSQIAGPSQPKPSLNIGTPSSDNKQVSGSWSGGQAASTSVIEQQAPCPVCCKPVPMSQINQHLDQCLR